ncbi:MAG: PAS domain S-box protein, partial [Burkholderiaceae bacterium]|nr:PAS domain S-box protein [Burkholderiaceae bacterium]
MAWRKPVHSRLRNHNAPAAPDPPVPAEGPQRASRIGAERIRLLRLAQQFEAIVESSDDAIIAKDLTGRVTSWNRAAERIFGYSAAEMIGKPMRMLFPPERLDEEVRILERIC